MAACGSLVAAGVLATGGTGDTIAGAVFAACNSGVGQYLCDKALLKDLQDDYTLQGSCKAGSAAGTSFTSPYVPVCASGQLVTSLYVTAEGCYSLLWTQIGGPLVFLSDPTSLNPTFIAPEVSSPTRLTFMLTAGVCNGPTGIKT